MVRRAEIRARIRLACGMICLLAVGAVHVGGQAAKTQSVRISVLSLFHPMELRVEAADGCALRWDGEDGEMKMDRPQLTARPSGEIVTLRMHHDRVEATLPGEGRTLTRSRYTATSACAASNAGLGGFWLQVPGKLRRRYLGGLEVRVKGRALEAVVTMPVETAVASIVQAESPPGARREALKAQAVAARSFLLARQTAHEGFDFCDTTHCQFLRSPPALGSPADRAAKATEGMVLKWHDAVTAEDRPLAAMYARSCGGRTRTLREIGVQSSGYPYFSVRCAYCSRHPEAWRREAGSGSIRTEGDRLAYNRIHGWAALPSLPKSSTGSDEAKGRGIGHGIGLCQLGAADMARHGAKFAQILAHYYPDTALTSR